MHQLVNPGSSPPRNRVQNLELRRATTLSAAELREAAIMMAAAFDSSPMFRSAFPKTATRSKIVYVLFTTVLEDALRHGRVEMAYNSGRIAGILIWYPPGRYPLSLARTLRLMPYYIRMVIAAPAGMLKLFRAQVTFNRHRPRAPHCHGYFLGGRPGEQVGSVLIKRLFAAVDELGHPIYLETQEPRSVNLYARLGFKRLQNGIEAFPGGPLTWTMWREPRSTT